MKVRIAMVASVLGVVCAGCASTKSPNSPVIAGPKVGDVGSVKEWKEGEQVAGEAGLVVLAPSIVGEGGPPPPLRSGTSSGSPEEDRSEQTQPAPSKKGSQEVFPFVRVDVDSKVVEFDAQVPAYAYVSKEGVVYLEVIVCTRDTREHEAALVTAARASDVHAAMLMAGLVPGAPGGWEWKDKALVAIQPKGEAVDVAFVVERNGKMVEEPATTWIYDVATGKTMAEEMHADEGFLFTGSGFVKNGGGERYAADGAGTLVGLATFGTETIAWKRVFSPESSVDEPVWAAKRDMQPAAGTQVVVRVKKK